MEDYVPNGVPDGLALYFKDRIYSTILLTTKKSRSTTNWHRIFEGRWSVEDSGKFCNIGPLSLLEWSEKE